MVLRLLYQILSLKIFAQENFNFSLGFQLYKTCIFSSIINLFESCARENQQRMSIRSSFRTSSVKNNLKLPPQALMEGRKAIDELQLKYDEKNKKDVNWLSSILGEIIRYPSLDLAERHRKANKLGALDAKTPEQRAKELEETLPDPDENYPDPFNKNTYIGPSSQTKSAIVPGTEKKRFMKRCKCCGLPEQEQELDLKTDIEQVNHLGMSTSLYFMTLVNLSTILSIMLYVFSIFAAVTNYHASKLYRESLGQSQVDQKFSTFKGILALSLGSKIYHQTQYCELTYAAQCWLGTMTILIWGFVLVYIKKSQKQYEYRVDFLTASAGDFSVFVLGIPIQHYDSNLVQLFQKSFDKYTTKMRQNIPNFHEIFGKIEQYEVKVHSVNRVSLVDLQKYYNDQSDQGDKLIQEYQEKMKKYEEEWVQLIEHRMKNYQFPISYQKMAKMEQDYERMRIEKRKRYKQISRIKSQSVSIINKYTQKFKSFCAFVTFYHTFNKELVQRLHERQKSFIHKFPCFQRREYLTLVGKDQKEVQVRVQPAPEPEDVIWANFHMTQTNRIIMKIVTIFMSAAAIALSFLLVFLILQVRAVVSQSSKKHKGLITMVLSGVISLILWLINFVLKNVIIYKFAKLERNVTYTSEQISIGVKSIVAVLINSIVVPLVANKIVTDNLYGVDGLADVVFFQALTNALLNPTLKILSPGYIISRLKRCWYNRPSKRLYLSQKQLNKLNQQIQFEPGPEYVEFVSMFLFTCFYASLQPIIVWITAIGFYFILYAQKLCLYKLRKRPTPGSSEINTVMYYFIFAGPLFYSIGSFCLTNIFSNFRPGIIPNVLAIILSLCIFLAPYDQIVRFLMKGKKQVRSSTFDEDRIFLPFQYSLLNPQTKDQAQTQYNNFFRNFLKNLKHQNRRKLAQISRKCQQQNLYSVREQEQQSSQEQNEDHGEPYIQILINNSDVQLMVKQNEQLEQFLKWRANDPEMRNVPYYINFGNHNNEDIIINDRNMENLPRDKQQDVDYDFHQYSKENKNYNQKIYDGDNVNQVGVSRIPEEAEQYQQDQSHLAPQRSILVQGVGYNYYEADELNNSQKQPYRPALVQGYQQPVRGRVLGLL